MIKTLSEPEKILQDLASKAVSHRALLKGNIDCPKISRKMKAGEFYEKTATEIEKKILTNLTSEDTLDVRIDWYI